MSIIVALIIFIIVITVVIIITDIKVEYNDDEVTTKGDGKPQNWVSFSENFYKSTGLVLGSLSRGNIKHYHLFSSTSLNNGFGEYLGVVPIREVESVHLAFGNDNAPPGGWEVSVYSYPNMSLIGGPFYSPSTVDIKDIEHNNVFILLTTFGADNYWLDSAEITYGTSSEAGINFTRREDIRVLMDVSDVSDESESDLDLYYQNVIYPTLQIEPIAILKSTVLESPDFNTNVHVQRAIAYTKPEDRVVVVYPRRINIIGVPSMLHITDGLNHTFVPMTDLNESQDMFGFKVFQPMTNSTTVTEYTTVANSSNLQPVRMYLYREASNL